LESFAAWLLAESPGKLMPEQIAALREYFRKDDELADVGEGVRAPSAPNTERRTLNVHR
jgi:hypothetical protein